MVICLLFFLSVLDGLVARFKEPLNHFSGVPGEVIAVTAPLTDGTDSLRDLTYKSSAEGLTLHFEAFQKGYWFGGAMWNGSLQIGPSLGPGTYTVMVWSRKEQRTAGSSVFQVDVYKNQDDLKSKAPSLLQRFLRVNPWQAALFFLPWVLLAFGMVYYLSGQRERLLLREGRAEIYRIKRVEDQEEIFFALGSRQGLRPGASLVLTNPQGVEVGSVTAREVFEDHATALVDPDWKVVPGFIVSR
jgi:hypothetical protein